MSSFKFLVTHISEDLKWTAMRKKADQTLYFLRSLRRSGLLPICWSVLTNCIITC